ncbi:uncharacterized protein LOC127585159 [Pristis pectinata]|uniref:uncharacterized protein LOC127585159 n=1 Tax=Pristis pectinata TaxID=685728 RepID=UPI00223CDF88|nr:uncharacterized protein LOC127585159 [Pristis pectinata]
MVGMEKMGQNGLFLCCTIPELPSLPTNTVRRMYLDERSVLGRKMELIEVAGTEQWAEWPYFRSVVKDYSCGSFRGRSRRCPRPGSRDDERSVPSACALLPPLPGALRSAARRRRSLSPPQPQPVPGIPPRASPRPPATAAWSPRLPHPRQQTASREAAIRWRPPAATTAPATENKLHRRDMRAPYPQTRMKTLHKHHHCSRVRPSDKLEGQQQANQALERWKLQRLGGRCHSCSGP